MWLIALLSGSLLGVVNWRFTKSRVAAGRLEQRIASDWLLFSTMGIAVASLAAGLALRTKDVPLGFNSAGAGVAACLDLFGAVVALSWRRAWRAGRLSIGDYRERVTAIVLVFGPASILLIGVGR